MPTDADNRRADATRNRDRILAVAAQLLGRKPAATMDEITAETGLGRTTVYRHFRTRDELIAAMYESVLVQAERAFEDTRPDGGDAQTAIARTIEAAFQASAEYRVLVYGPAVALTDEEGQLSPAMVRFLDPVARVMARAQREGVLRADVPPRWLADVLVTLVFGAIMHGRDLRAVKQQPAQLVLHTFLHGHAPPRRRP